MTKRTDHLSTLRNISLATNTGRWRGCSGGGEGLANDLLELGEVERLAQDGQARLREEAMQLGGSDAPRQEDDLGHGVVLPFGQRAIEADAIEQGHVEIAEDQVEVGVPDLLEGGHAVLRAVDVIAFHVEHVYDESNARVFGPKSTSRGIHNTNPMP